MEIADRYFFLQDRSATRTLVVIYTGSCILSRLPRGGKLKSTSCGKAKAILAFWESHPTAVSRTVEPLIKLLVLSTKSRAPQSFS